MASLEKLILGINKIGDAGCTALADACASGSMAGLQKAYVSGNPASQEAQQAVMDAIQNRQ